MAAAASTGRQRYRWLLLLVGGDDARRLAGQPAVGRSDDPTPAATARRPRRRRSSSTSSSTPTTRPTRPTRRAACPSYASPPSRPRRRGRVELIDAGGPFPEPDHDGGTFGNREELLPDQPMGYYREYTVPTPGVDHRGARRIVAGDGGELYWTDDHYSSFSRIRR